MVQQSIAIRAPIQTVYDTIVDFQSYPEFLPETRSVCVEWCEDQSMEVSFKIAFIKTPRLLSAAPYIVMGWLGVLGGGELFRVFPAGAIAWLVAGGLFYSVGAIVYVTKTLNFKPGVFGFHEVWHLFVIAGCLCHYMVMLLYIAPYSRVP